MHVEEVSQNRFKNYNYIYLGLEYPEWETTYVQINEKIEKWSEIIHFVIAKLTPLCLILPKFIVSLSIYFTIVSETVELELPLPMW